MKGLILTYVLCYGGAPVAVFNPYIGLLIYIAFAIVKPEATWYWAVPPGNYSRIVAIAMLVGWVIKGMGNWRIGKGAIVLVALFCFVAWLVVAMGMGPSGLAGGMGLLEQYGKIVLPCLVGITLIDDVRKLKGLAWTMAMAQGYLAYEFNLSYYAGINRVTADPGFANMDNNCVAVLMVTGAGLAFFLGMGERRWWLKLLAFASAALQTHVIMFSFSRGGQVGLIVTGIVAFLLVPKQPKHVLLFALAVALALRLAGPEVRTRFVTTFADREERDRSSESRLETWGYCLQAMKTNPLFGIGPGNWDSYVLKFREEVVMAHSSWLQTGAELGVPGLFFLLSFYGWAIIRLWPLTWKSTRVPDPFYHDAARMVISALVGYMVAGQFVSLALAELPFYITMFGICTLKLWSTPVGWVETAEAATPFRRGALGGWRPATA